MEERAQFGGDVMKSDLPVVVEIVEGETRQSRSLDEADRWAGSRGWERHVRVPAWSTGGWGRRSRPCASRSVEGDALPPPDAPEAGGGQEVAGAVA
jgi:hypothetical protein